MVLRLDQSDWVNLSNQLYLKKDPWEEIPVVVPYPCDRAIVAITVSARPSWVDAGGVAQSWSRLFVPIEVGSFRLRLSRATLIRLEPLENSTLWFWSHHWITELSISVEVRRYEE